MAASSMRRWRTLPVAMAPLSEGMLASVESPTPQSGSRNESRHFRRLCMVGSRGDGSTRPSLTRSSESASSWGTAVRREVMWTRWGGRTEERGSKHSAGLVGATMGEDALRALAGRQRGLGRDASFCGVSYGCARPAHKQTRSEGTSKSRIPATQTACGHSHRSRLCRSEDMGGSVTTAAAWLGGESAERMAGGLCALMVNSTGVHSTCAGHCKDRERRAGSAIGLTTSVLGASQAQVAE